MAMICLALAVGCGIGAAVVWEDRGLRVFLIACALLNGAAAADMLATQYAYAWRLAPHQYDTDPGYHYRR